MTSRADQLRQARLDFEQAMALGCTIPEARARRQADRRFLRHPAGTEVAGHTETLMSAPSEASQASFERFDAPWMMRN